MRKCASSALVGGVGVTLLQLGLVWSIAPSHPLPLLSRLTSWDSQWYGSIVLYGYQNHDPPLPMEPKLCNVAFFPAFPMLGRLLHLTLQLPFDLCLAVIAMTAAVMFWTGLLLLLRKWQVGLKSQLITVMAVLAHPCAFFLVAGYTESLFLASLIFYLLFAEDCPLRYRLIPTGCLMSATRIVGIPQVFYPIFIHLLSLRRFAEFWHNYRIWLFSLGGALGGALFFVYCKVCFGRFGLYFEMQRIGWSVVPDYLVPFHTKDFFYDQPYSHYTLIISVVALSLTVSYELGRAIILQHRPDPKRSALWLSSAAQFYIALSGLKAIGFRSLIRYSLPYGILLILFAVNASRSWRWSQTRWLIPLAFFLSALSWIKLGASYFVRFSDGPDFFA